MFKGLLSVKVTDLNTNYPIEGAKIKICTMPKDECKKVKVLYNCLCTDSSGEVIKIILDAPNYVYSQLPSQHRAYATYLIKITKEGYQPVVIQGVQILPYVEAIQTIQMSKITPLSANAQSIFTIDDHTLYKNYPPKISEPSLKPAEPTILSQVVVPEYIIVHDGMPNDSSAPNYWIPFKDYVKNVASSEIYATWPTQTIYANVVAIISFTLNRVYTEWYKSQGYNFTITSTTAYDHKFIYNRNIFDTISIAVDNIFNVYIRRPKSAKQPLLAQYCDGIQTQCPGKMTQWGSKYLGDQGYMFEDILKYFYGYDLALQGTDMIEGIPSSYPGYPLTLWDSGSDVKTIQIQLNAINNAYPAIPEVDEDGIYGPATQASVKKFQEIFGLPSSGIVDFATWYEISRVYVAVTKIAES